MTAVTQTANDPTEDDDARYFDRRAERQLELAQAARHPAAVAAHCAIAESYMTRRAQAEAEAHAA